MSFKRSFVAWAPVFLWMLTIFLLSSRSAINTGTAYWTDFLMKKVAHVLEYLFLTVLVFRALRLSTRISLKNALIWSFIWAVSYGITDEFHQSFVPTREPRFRDVIIDAGGSIGGLLLILKTKYTTG